MNEVGHVSPTDHTIEQSATSPVRSVTATGVSDIRREVGEAARRAGLGDDRADRLVVAVNEIVINAIQHGGGRADVTITATVDGLVVAVRDYGDGLPPDLTTERPPPGQLHGRGLWLAGQLCDVTLDRVDTGTLVRLAATRRPSPRGPDSINP